MDILETPRSGGVFLCALHSAANQRRGSGLEIYVYAGRKPVCGGKNAQLPLMLRHPNLLMN